MGGDAAMQFRIAVVAYTDLSRFPSDRQVSYRAFRADHLPSTITAQTYTITEVDTLHQAKQAALVKHQQARPGKETRA